MKKETTKDRIFAAASKLFIEHGFAATSIADIANAAGVNHSLIFHHFGNKEGLWLAVKAEISHRAQKHGAILPSTQLPFQEFLHELFVRTFDYYQASPDIIRMINWQRLDPANKRNIGVTDSEEMRQWIAAFTEYQARGIINKRIRPEFLITMILGIISSAALDPNIYILGDDQRKAYIEFCVMGISSITS